MILHDDLEIINLENLDEHVYELFVQRANSQTSNGLGLVARKNGTIEVTVGDKDVNITQDLSQLNSSKQSSSTGFVAWKVSPIFFEWLQASTCKLNGLISLDSVIVELGTGISGIGPIVLGDKVNRYIATDQEHLLKLLKHNIDENMVSTRYFGKNSIKLHPVIDITEFDWEYPQTIENFEGKISNIGENGIVIACDTIYNDYLIPHFVNAVNSVLNCMGSGSILLVAQQLRCEEILESALNALILSGLTCYSIPDGLLSEKLIDGFSVHLFVC